MTEVDDVEVRDSGPVAIKGVPVRYGREFQFVESSPIFTL